MVDDDLSPAWNSPMGTITCDECYTQWPCHFAAWMYPGRNYCECGGRLSWDPVKDLDETLTKP